MLDKQNQDPQCVACDSPMRLAVIEPSIWSQYLRTFVCPQCNSSELHFIESTVTEAWLANESSENLIEDRAHRPGRARKRAAIARGVSQN
jgi:hypothetical protein